MRLSVFVGVLAIGAGVAMGKILHDREAASLPPLPAPGSTMGPASTGSPAPARSNDPAARSSPASTPGKATPLTAEERKLLEEPRGLLAKGRFEDARMASLSSDTRASASLRGALRVLAERATLYSVLTRGIRRH